MSVISSLNEIKSIELSQDLQVAVDLGVASRAKFSTSVYLQLRLARPCVHVC